MHIHRHTFGKVAVTQTKLKMVAGNDEASQKVGEGGLQDSCIPFQTYIGLED